MKQLIILFAAAMLIGCNYDHDRSNDVINNDHFNDYEVVVIDSCEYIEYASYRDILEVTHKGNCKFCTERNNKNR